MKKTSFLKRAYAPFRIRPIAGRSIAWLRMRVKRILPACRQTFGSFAVSFLLTLSVVLGGCSPLVREDVLPDTDKTYPVSIRVECPDMSVVSKSLNASQEKQIRDLNLYLYHETNPEAHRHIYSDAVSGPLMTELVAGNYTLYAVANAGNDMGKLPETGISAYYFPVSSENSLEKNGVLLSSVRMEFAVNQAMTLPVSLRHNVSKISLNLSTAASYSGFTIRSIRMLSVPKGMSVFADNGASAVTETFDYPKRTVDSRTYAGIFYLPENLQGVVSKITDQRDKNLQNAPARATCILIEGDKDGRAIYYRIYPGENNTSDFNIRRNRHYTINATIQGENILDTRVSTVEVSLGGIPTPCDVGDKISTTLTIRCTGDPENQIYLNPSLLEGGGTLTVNGTAAAGTAIPVCKGDQTRSIPIVYTQTTEGAARMRFIVSDSYGYTVSKDLATYFQQIHPVTADYNEKSWSRETYTPFEFSVKVNQQGYTNAFDVKYELLQGTGEMFYGSQAVSNGSTFSTGANNPASGTQCVFRFTPSEIGKLTFRLTFIGKRGQTFVLEKDFDVIPYKIQIRGSYEIEKSETKIIAQDGFTGPYYEKFKELMVLTADRTVPAGLRLRVTTSIHHLVDRYDLGSLTPNEWGAETTSSVYIESGTVRGERIMAEYEGACIGTSGNMKKVLIPGYLPRTISGSLTGDDYYSKTTVWRIYCEPESNTIECINLSPWQPPK